MARIAARASQGAKAKEKLSSTVAQLAGIIMFERIAGCRDISSHILCRMVHHAGSQGFRTKNCRIYSTMMHHAHTHLSGIFPRLFVSFLGEGHLLEDSMAQVLLANAVLLAVF